MYIIFHLIILFCSKLKIGKDSLNPDPRSTWPIRIKCAQLKIIKYLKIGKAILWQGKTAKVSKIFIKFQDLFMITHQIKERPDIWINDYSKHIV